MLDNGSLPSRPEQPFEFRAATRLVVGAGAVGRLGALARELGGTRALVASDPGVVRAGHTAAALCLPLGNYHNMGPRGRIAAEKIDLGDFASLVQLLVALAACDRLPGEADTQLRAGFETLLAERGGLLEE